MSIPSRDYMIFSSLNIFFLKCYYTTTLYHSVSFFYVYGTWLIHVLLCSSISYHVQNIFKNIQNIKKVIMEIGVLIIMSENGDRMAGNWLEYMHRLSLFVFVAQYDELLLLLHNFRNKLFQVSQNSFIRKKSSKRNNLKLFSRKSDGKSVYAVFFCISSFPAISLYVDLKVLKNERVPTKKNQHTSESILVLGRHFIATLNIINNDFDTRQIQKTNRQAIERWKKRNTGSKLPIH